MTEGEQELREKLGKHRTKADVNDIIAAIRTAHVYIHLGEISKVSWDNPVDWQDDGIIYSVKVEDFAEDEDE